MTRHDGGFTLLEMAVVLIVLGLVAAVALPGRLDGRGVELKSAARQLAAGLRAAHARAVASDREVALVVDVDRRVWWLPGRPPQRLPPSAGISLFTATSERLGEAVGAIRFFPDGGSTGGGLRIERAGEAYTIRADWLTGRVEVRNGT